jgi:serine palmitoyltransferase
MDIHDAHEYLLRFSNELSIQFQRVPGSAIFLRYVKASYQNDPVRSAVELFLLIFFVRYLLAPKYSTQKQNYVQLSDEVYCWLRSQWALTVLTLDQEIDELVEDWTPEPLVAPQTAFEEAEIEKYPVIVG